MPEGSIAMLDVDHHIHLIPVHRVLMLGIEHSSLKKGEHERFEVTCTLRLSSEGGSHQFEDCLRLSFAAAGMPGQHFMTELTFVQNHIIKNAFDRALAGEPGCCKPDDPLAKETGVSLGSLIMAQMLASPMLREILTRHGALPESMTITH